jgi:hypothetical protein
MNLTTLTPSGCALTIERATAPLPKSRACHRAEPVSSAQDSASAVANLSGRVQQDAWAGCKLNVHANLDALVERTRDEIAARRVKMDGTARLLVGSYLELFSVGRVSELVPVRYTPGSETVATARMGVAPSGAERGVAWRDGAMEYT